tara:strand:- start:510 stop:1451 length:942 start_codon:yes stop_codon:yes gene_type:complete
MLNKKQTYQLEFIKNNPIVRNAGPWNDDIYVHNLEFALKKLNKFTILCPQEVFPELDYLENLQNIIRNHPNKEIYISCSTTTDYEYSLDPLLNVLFWRDTYSRNEIAWEAGDISIFDEQYYKPLEKQNPFILSIRKERKIRDVVFSNLTGKYNGIVRYAKWPEQGWEDKNWEKENTNKFPTFIELVNEYKQSYIAFIIETNSSYCMTQFSEKILLAFLTKTLPIAIGSPNFNKELTKMGFYTFNENFDIADEGFEESILNSFSNSVNLINNMKLKSIEKLYNNNIDKIEHNYKLVTYLLWGNPLITHSRAKFI